jgi:5-methylthioadenosine/S-adenosylhomocysteine deaminase
MQTQADLLITDAAILTADTRDTIIERGDIVIVGQHIAPIGQGIAANYVASETIDGRDHIAMPGLIDTHVHTAQQCERSLLK